MEALARRDSADPGRQTLLLLRWLLIIATGYLVLFHRGAPQNLPAVGLFLAGYLASNLLVGAMLRRVRSERLLEMGLVVFDAVAVAAALLLTGSGSSDFFLLYFVVLFIATLSERLEFVAGTAVLISFIHVSATAWIVGIDHVLSSGELLRIPFLLVVATFFGYLVDRARSAEREAHHAGDRERMVGDFVSGVIHDLKNPLGVIQAISEILLERQSGSLTAEQTELVRRVHANARHTTKIAENLIEARQIEAGRMHLRREPANLTDVVLEELNVVRSASDLKGISLEFESAPTLPKLAIDVGQMDRVVWNLLENAVRSSPTGGEVVVSLDHTDKDVLLSITDDGRGFSEEDLPLLFERYKPRRSGQYTSEGLGLFVAKAVVEAHGGTIEVDSVVGGGTTFTVRLPITAVESPATKARRGSAVHLARLSS